MILIQQRSRRNTKTHLDTHSCQFGDQIFEHVRDSDNVQITAAQAVDHVALRDGDGRFDTADRLSLTAQGLETLLMTDLVFGSADAAELAVRSQDGRCPLRRHINRRYRSSAVTARSRRVESDRQQRSARSTDVRSRIVGTVHQPIL